MIRLCLLFLFVVLLPVSARASQAEATAQYETGLKHFQAKSYDQAVIAFEASHRAKKSVNALYGWAQSERLRGNCIKAVGLYRQVLTMELTPSQNQKTRAALALCADAVTVAPEPPADPRVDPPPPAASPPSGSETKTVQATVERKHWYSDPLGHVLFVGGLAGVGTGLALFFKSAADADAAPMATNLQGYEDQRSSAETLRLVSLLSLGAGGVLTALGIYRYATVDGDPAPIAFWVGDNGGHIAWRGSF